MNYFKSPKNSPTTNEFVSRKSAVLSVVLSKLVNPSQVNKAKHWTVFLINSKTESQVETLLNCPSPLHTGQESS